MRCSIDGCGQRQHARGWCNKHYLRWMNTGTTDDPPALTIEERFWAKVAQSADCWLWAAARNPKGYGRFRADHSDVMAHRYSWELQNGPIPEGMFILHTCDNPPCVNPAHLFLGSAADNTADMVAKGRNWQQKVTHCPQGHEYTEANTYLATNPNGNPRRNCRACHRSKGK